jgi:HAD superfamily hydrolase (TIGR01509 family)
MSPLSKLPLLPKAVVFDMDGLLLESETFYHRSFYLAADERGFDLPKDNYQRLCGSTWNVIGTMLRDEHGPDFPVEEFGERWRHHLEILMAEGIPLKPGVMEMLELLDELSIPRAIATSSFRVSLDRHLGPHDILHRFDHILTRESYQEPKPAPAPYLTAAKQLGIEPQFCLALEDSHQGVRSASRAGMMTVMVPDVALPNDEMRDACVMIVDSLINVRDAIITSQQL